MPSRPGLWYAADEDQRTRHKQDMAALQVKAQAASQEAEALIQQALSASPSEQAIHQVVKQAAQAMGEQAKSLNG